MIGEKAVDLIRGVSRVASGTREEAEAAVAQSAIHHQETRHATT